jgi:hypothetical protein
MPAFTVLVDGDLIATVSTDDYNVVSISASGQAINEEFVSLDVSGGKYPENGDSTHHLFVCDYRLSPRQVVTVQMKETGTSEPKGRTIEEVYSEEESSRSNVDFKTKTEIFEELKKMKRLREKYTLRVELSNQTTFLGDTKPSMHGFSFSVLWNWTKPESARVSLCSHTIDNLENKSPLTYYLEERIQVADSVLFEAVSSD